MRFIIRRSNRVALPNRVLVLAAFFICFGIIPVIGQSADEPAKSSDSDRTNAESETSAAKIGVEQTSDELRVEFSGDAPGVIIIETGGKKYRIDSNTKTFRELERTAHDTTTSDEEIAVPGSNLNENSGSAAGINDDDEELGDYDFEPGDEPFDYRIVNVPTPKSVPKGTWNLSFSHRFSQPIHPISRSAETLLGFDSFSISSFGVTYGITDQLYVSVSRSPICRRSLCRTIEIGAGYHLLDQTDESPVGLTFYGSVEGDRNFSRDYTFNLQTMVSRREGNRVYFFFSPAVHLNTNGNRRFDPKPDEFFPPALIADSFSLPAHTASFGFGTTVMITPKVLALFEFTPRVGFKLGRVTPVFDDMFNIIGFKNKSFPALGFGIQKNIGNHSFALTFSNTQTTTTSRYNSSNLVLSPKRMVIGFNLFRRL